ncbi:hypothetical protein BDR26DRAFT_631509 [Obelidium mucronatum]|nr:hypothetical protein BDR26DRAFT_631509 [Obelidium mucronatum]
MFSSTSITAMRQVLMKHSLQRSKILDNLGIISRNLYVDAQEAFFANHKQHANYMYTLAFSFKPMSSIPITSPLHDALLLELGPLLDKLSEIPSLTDKSHLIINMLTSFVQFELAPTNETREDWFFAYGFSINSIFKICVDPAERKNVLTVVEMGRAKAHAFISKNNIQRAEFLIDMQSDSIPTNNPVEIDDHIASCVDLYGPIDLSDLESCWSSIPIRLEDLRETLGLIRVCWIVTVLTIYNS